MYITETEMTTKQYIISQELHDYGGGIPNELVVTLERCVGLSARWPGLLPDAYLTYRFYDLPPHVSQTAQCTADPVFNDRASYPLAVTADILHYLRYDNPETGTKLAGRYPISVVSSSKFHSFYVSTR